MKLYIWDHALALDNCGIIVAHANTLEEAKQAVLDNAEESYKKWLKEDMDRENPLVFQGVMSAYRMGQDG